MSNTMERARSNRKKCSLTLKTSEKFKSWLAGMIDGEGNFYARDKNRISPQIRICLVDRDKFVLDYIASNIGGTVYYIKPQKSWKPNWNAQYGWRLRTFYDCLKFTEWILPDLILKKETAQKFLELLRRRK